MKSSIPQMPCQHAHLAAKSALRYPSSLRSSKIANSALAGSKGKRLKVVFAQGTSDEEAPKGPGLLKKLGVELGPIGLSLQGSEKKKKNAEEPRKKSLEKLAEDAGISLGPIALSLGESMDSGAKESGADVEPQASMSEATVADWEAEHLDTEGAISLWMEDDFNAPSRLPGGRTFDGRENVTWSGKEESDADVPVHQVTVRYDFASPPPVTSRTGRATPPKLRDVVWAVLFTIHYFRTACGKTIAI
ncbi:Ferredoxin-1, chloroplastic [Cymbomonas tetramitiformis]|uniref:Ferredoxin-1, chloroplastic n=1 Tax=Cymbomonas tetramitiformis TaxID=36881 RepID=A0AAE0BQ47_9CHLO|nr:Ferredoxin-1, chloroplastic [Cymbomonas tetramitiformis]